MQKANNCDLLFAIQDHGSEETVRSKNTTLTGWCFAENGTPIDGIRARIGNRNFVARRKQTRWNVAAMYPTHPQAVSSGFTVEISLPRGTSEVCLEAKMEGKWIVFAHLKFKRHWFSLAGRSKAPALNYRDWVHRFDQWPPEQLSEWKRDIEDSFQTGPLISILLPVYNTPEKLLRECLDSVLMQIYPHWELCVTDDASTAPHVSPLLEEYGRKDGRIRIHHRKINGHICAASNDALTLATGAYCALFDHDDVLAPHALYMICKEIRSNPDVVLIYSDEDKLDLRGQRTDPYFKGDWDPELLLGQNYLNHLTVYRTDHIRSAGRFREGFEGSQDWDLALRITEKCDQTQIRHIPHILYHWRITEGSTAASMGEKPYASIAAEKTIKEALARRKLASCSVALQADHYIKITRPLPHPLPQVAIIIPTHDLFELLQRCISSLLAHTDYENWKLIIVDHESSDESTLAYLRQLEAQGTATVLRESGAFNFSRLNNRAVASAPWADVVVLLNNDTYVTDAGWLAELVSQAIRPEIGAVGARLLYPNGLFQHAGVFLGYLGAAGHLARGTDGSLGANSSWTKLTRTVSAVTAACMAVERTKYLAVGGMDETVFGVAYNDVDFCLRLSHAGYRTLYTPLSTVIHDESVTRGPAEKTPDGKLRANREISILQERWGALIKRDPFYNPNLTSAGENLLPNFDIVQPAQ